MFLPRSVIRLFERVDDSDAKFAKRDFIKAAKAYNSDYVVTQKVFNDVSFLLILIADYLAKLPCLL
jgi:hypothetical protein